MSRFKSFFVFFILLVFSIPSLSFPKIDVINQNDNYLLVTQKSLPIIDLNITFKTGSRHDGQFKGITNYSINLLHQQIHKNEKFIDSLERIGATYSSNVTRDSSSLSIRFVNTDNNRHFISNQINQMLNNRAISKKTFDLTKEALLDQVISRDLGPSSLLSYKSNEIFFQNTGYAHPIIGYGKDIKRISIENIVNHLNKIINLDNIKINIVGNINQRESAFFISNLLNGLPVTHNIDDVKYSLTSVNKSNVKFYSDSNQTHISIMIPAITRKHKSFYNILVANYILGGSGFGSMLMREIREKNGLAYSIYSYLMPYKDIGVLMISMQTATSNSDKALTILLNQIDIFQNVEFTEKQIESAKLALIKGFSLRFDTNRKILNTLSAINEYGMHNDYYREYIDGLESVTKSTITKSIKDNIRFNNIFISTAGRN